MSEHDINLVTSKAGSTVVENLKVTLATPAAALTPATFTAMIGISQGSALTLGNSVQVAMAQLANIAASNSSANVDAAAALSSMTSLQSSLGFGGTPNHAAFGSFLSQAQGHIQDSIEVRKATDFMANMNYSDLGGGITDLGSSVDRGMSASLGSLSSVGAMMASTGSMFNGADIKNFGSSTGIVKSLLDNKLADVTGVKSALASAGVPLNDLDNPLYADKIHLALSGIKNPNTINIVADQFNISPAGGLPPPAPQLSRVVGSDTGNWEVFGTVDATGPTFRVVGSSGSTIYSGSATSVIEDINFAIEYNTVTAPDPEFDAGFFENLKTTVGNLEGELQDAHLNNTTDIQSLADVGDPSKLDPESSAGVSTSAPIAGLPSSVSGAASGLISGLGGAVSGLVSGLGSAVSGIASGISSATSSLTTHLADLGAGTIKNASAAPGLFGQIQSVQTPLNAASFPSLGGLIKDHQSTIDSMTGSGTGPLGLPSMTDFTQHLAGGPSITSFLQNVNTDPSSAISALNTSIAGASSLFATAGVDLTSPAPNNLGTAMAFAQNLHKFGADTSGSGIADILHNMADVSTPYGEAIKASLAEGKNSKLLSDNAIPPITTTPPPPAPGQSNVEYPITVSREFQRTSGGTVTIEATANSATDQLWRIINGSEATTNGQFGPHAVMYTGTYDYIYQLIKGNPDSSDPNKSAYTILRALPGMKAQLDGQISGGSPKALG